MSKIFKNVKNVQNFFFFMIFGHNCSCPITRDCAFVYTNLFVCAAILAQRRHRDDYGKTKTREFIDLFFLLSTLVVYFTVSVFAENPCF